MNAPDLIVPGIILGGAGLISIVMMLLAMAQWIKVAAGRRWPVAQGTVRESRVGKVRDGRGAWSWRPFVTYTYQVRGELYTNDLLTFGARLVSEWGDDPEKRAQETVARYPLGSLVEVHHHPSRPWQSVLEVRSAASRWLVIGGIIFLAAGILGAAVVLVVKVAS